MRKFLNAALAILLGAQFRSADLSATYPQYKDFTNSLQGLAEGWRSKNAQRRRRRELLLTGGLADD